MPNIESAIPLNVVLFNLLAADTGSPTWLVLAAKGFAEYGPFVALAIAAMVYFGDRQRQHAAMLAAGTMVVGLAANFIFASVTYVPRPFELGLGLNLLHHAPETSFPSDHATLIWSIGLGLLLFDRKRWPGIAVVALGFATAWARVYLGAHFPFDMAGSLVISAVAVSIVMLLRPWLERLMLPIADRSHDGLADLLQNLRSKIIAR